MREPASSEPTDISGVDQGRAATFQGLAEGHLDASYRLANSILSNPAEAQDAVHDAFVTAWEKWNTLRDVAKFDPWFKRIVVNTCRDRLRRKARTETDISEQDSLTTPDATAGITDRVRVEQALKRLRPDDRVLIALRHHHDLKVADIARLIGVPEGTVKWRLSTAHKRLRELLEPAEGDSR